jgi:hypothetical protein
MLRRILAGALGALGAANGLFMLADGPRWYQSVPGVVHTGPFNPHFVADIGAAFLAAGAALIARAWRPALWPAAVAGAAFIGLHGLIHVVDIAAGRAHDAATDAGLVIVPAALTLWAALPGKGEIHA